MPMEELGHLIFGVPWPRQLPVFPAGERQIQEPYVCIGVQASHPAKGWLYPDGWEIVTAALREAGDRVLCIDKGRENSADGFSAQIPAGAEDFTGEHPIEERAELLAHADFFIGLSSGLSWLAYFVGCPVVIICGKIIFEIPAGASRAVRKGFSNARRQLRRAWCSTPFADCSRIGNGWHDFFGCACLTRGRFVF